MSILKIIGIFILGILILFFICFIYIRNIAIGSEKGSVPEGYKIIKINDLKFSVKISGKESDIPVILLHGFPESSAMWHGLMYDLNKLGYYTIAPDQRGYSTQARPKNRAAYNLSFLVQDVVALADSLGIYAFQLIGHDWGSAVGWQIAEKYPTRIISFTSLSVPHLDAFARAYNEDSLQHRASKYIRNFQTPYLPEYYLAKNNYEMLRSIWSSHDMDEVNAYLHLFKEKYALTSALNWYRANFQSFTDKSEHEKVNVPVLFIWGNKDKALLRSGAEWTRSYVKAYYRFIELDAGHWLIQEDYDTVKNEIIAHLNEFNQTPG